MSLPCPGPNGIREWISAKPITFWQFWRYVFTGLRPGEKWEYRLPKDEGK